ncbi:WD repeat protein [Spraguea lophii 42_110]|uniref:WD repeat protein n=1 Tax=Spraguea lophii (strain 42_110) TaxID=1358809 RepID=S7WAW7_SPRLO|nr:WD repeat protein [Spraguea lophii 42_110]
MTYLPYHYLLAVAQHNKLTYIDITTGKKVKEIDSKFSHILKQNKGIIYSTVNNKINLFSPNTNENKNNNGNPIISILAHKNNIDTLEVNDNYIYSTANNILNIHDIRNTYKHVESTNIKYRAYTSSLSDNNVLALSHRNKIQTYYLNNTHNHSHTIENNNDIIKDNDITNNNNTIENNNISTISPYLSGRIKNNISNLTFIPHEDILSIGHAKGIESFIIPGSGNPNYSEYDNPFSENRREMKIRKLLEKIPIELIGIEHPFEIEERGETKKEEIKEEKKKKILHRIFDE